MPTVRITNLATLLCFIAGLGVVGGVYRMVMSLSVESFGCVTVSSQTLDGGLSSLDMLGLMMLALILAFLSFISHCAFILARKGFLLGLKHGHFLAGGVLSMEELMVLSLSLVFCGAAVISSVLNLNSLTVGWWLIISRLLR